MIFSCRLLLIYLVDHIPNQIDNDFNGVGDACDEFDEQHFDDLITQLEETYVAFVDAFEDAQNQLETAYCAGDDESVLAAEMGIAIMAGWTSVMSEASGAYAEDMSETGRDKLVKKLVYYRDLFANLAVEMAESLEDERTCVVSIDYIPIYVR